MIQSMTSGASVDLHPPIGQVRVQLSTSSDVIRRRIVVGQRLEDDDLVDAVDELGLKVRFTSPITMSLTFLSIALVSLAWKPSDAFFWMKRAPMFDVMMMIAFLKFTRLPSRRSDGRLRTPAAGC
jgi:hypothetical protein